MFSLLRGVVPPSPLAGSCSEYGSAYWVRVGQAGANMSEASGQPPSAWKRAPNVLDAKGRLIRVTLRRSRLHGRG